MSPLFLLVLAHSPNRSAAESVLTVSTPWARESEGPAHARNRQAARKVLAVFVMSALYPRRVDSEPLHAPVKIGSVRLQSSRGVSNVSSSLGERSRNHRSLEAVQFFRQRSRSAGNCFARFTNALLRTSGRRDEKILRLVAVDDEDVFYLLSGDLGAWMQDRESLHDVGELANIAGPRVVPQQLQCVTPQAWFCLTGPLQKLLREMLDQLENVVAPLAQWRNRKRNHLQPEVQVLAKRSGAHRALKI